ncbi:hypothetical protein FGSG_12285 [Fusarium graminearum PH-1]|uniref:Chromosome 2, complete genome n=1 Tax=Gibberella zeae (strain ATCC MYA-4620 / CBS 123657 / FGSC 9075 / NRRL 31084 / PH-1) TaxID=229533 RepID=I1S614_GIBZE|nr:hypothetical protein FGSG_12285 [Fusarium graminearum PH-1]ESU08877.1 hypothetical protein FGSG_12285 [Fusarium graminearum PH-1]EYB25030.1 hypothetical protein FG05_12285 [Fusarium graminearum]CEF79217.1 unnamed protein product [Fusarium graminearum]|eukprot:XP_011321376.1 hypothetical protein FGSG_12285 [Fusarium graminearum PH-1]
MPHRIKRLVGCLTGYLSAYSDRDVAQLYSKNLGDDSSQHSETNEIHRRRSEAGCAKPQRTERWWVPAAEHVTRMMFFLALRAEFDAEGAVRGRLGEIRSDRNVLPRLDLLTPLDNGIVPQQGGSGVPRTLSSISARLLVSVWANSGDPCRHTNKPIIKTLRMRGLNLFQKRVVSLHSHAMASDARIPRYKMQRYLTPQDIRT